MSAVAKRYARALFEVASEKNVIDATEKELLGVVKVIDDNEGLRKLLSHPKISAEEKKQLLETLFAREISANTGNFLNIVIERGREGQLKEIVDNFIEMANDVRGIADATVVTAKALTDEEVKQLADGFGRQLNKKLRVKTEVDPALIGGIVVRIGDRLYDGSIRGKLSRFSQQIKQAQV
jgi:F-type H+-transporting ATPase subunit delta